MTPTKQVSLVTCRRDLNSLTILIDKIPHVRIALETFIGFQSWLWTQPRVTFERGVCGSRQFEIEIYFSDAKPIRLVYVDRFIWEQVLKYLDT